MAILQLRPADIEKVRFAYSPLIELSISFKLLQQTEMHASYQPWIAETQRKLEGNELPFMKAIILSHSYIADFITPTPPKTILRIEDELERVRETPLEVIRHDIERAIQMAGMTPIRAMFLEHPREAMECLLEEVRFYWEQALEPHWGQLSAALERDLLFRARALALYGIDAMFMDLSDSIEYQHGLIETHKNLAENRPKSPKIYQLNGRGIQLVPSMFGSASECSQIAPYWLPMVIYQARGAGLWQRANNREPDEALSLTLGTSRARLLQALAEPAHTNDLALRLHLTAGAVSQQLGRLAQAGLIESYRSGSKVYYRLSQRGERLLDVFIK